MMNVVKFPLSQAYSPRPGWRSAELQRLTSACAGYLPTGQASGWEFGETERGDPQLYLLGPGPKQDCILSISRLGQLYILEDGKGRVLFEHDNLLLFAEQAAAALSRKKKAILAQIAVAWYAAREFYEEKVEPALAESIEAASHFASPLGVLA
jgi:hypothetical protein